MVFHPVVAGSAASILGYPIGHYITSQRDLLDNSGVPLINGIKSRLGEYFPRADLDRARLVEREPIPIAAPPFRRTARLLGLYFPELRFAGAITLDHIIASREPLVLSVLFHELVHVVQFRLLGVDAFARLYVRGLLRGGSYEGIPLERCALELEHRFEISSSRFDVDAEVKSWIKRDLF